MNAAPAQSTLFPVVVGIAGCSGSGKTTLARELAKSLHAQLFPLDFYYRDLAHLPPDERPQRNFDHPDSLESELFLAHLRALKSGAAIDRPIYDFKNHVRVSGQADHIEPAPFIIVEGIMALHWPELCELFDFSVYVETPHDICLMRRIFRDMRERGRTEESVRTQYETAVQPMADRFVIPSRARATMTVTGTESLDWSIELILRALHLQGLG